MKSLRTALSLGFVAAIATVIGASSDADAATQTSQMNVAMAVSTTCSISGVNDIIVGPYIGNQFDGGGSFDITCNRPVNGFLSFSWGLNPAGTTRRMANGANRLSYNIYSDPGMTTMWTPTGVPISSASNTVNIIAYGRIFGGQNVPIGVYQDTITISWLY